MDTFLWIFCILGWVVVGVLVFTCYRFYRKAVIYDEIFQFLYDDIYTNLKQFNKMAHSNVLMADTEIQSAHRNMMTMGDRLEEILRRMEQATGLRLRPPDPGPRPKFG